MKTKIDIDKKSVRNYSIVLIIGLVLGWVFFHSSEKTTETSHNHVEQAEEAIIWTCSMHPQIKQDKPGQCPICAMDLIPLVTNISDEEGVDPNEIEMSEAAMKLAQIQTLIVKKEYSNKEVYLLGKVKPDERNISELTARFGGRIEKLYTNFTGQNVVKGEKLATIYSPELVIAQKELLESIKYKESNPAFYRASRNKLKLWDLTESQIDGIETKGEPQNYFDVLSPISGTVTMRHVSIGDYIKEGNALFQVINLKKVWLMFEAYESDLPWLSRGDKVEFTVQSLPGETFTGKVTFIDPFLDAKTRVAKVRVEVDNPKLELKPEMFANGIIKPKISGGQKDLMIPKTAVLWTGKRAVVYVKMPERKHNSFLYREIILGPEAGEFYIVKEGLYEGEEIAVNGVFKIDAASQLEGKPSMMNPSGGAGSTPHDMSKMNMGGESKSSKEQDKIQMDSKSGKMEGMNHDVQPMEANVEHVMFKVSGNCEMCKSTIEKAASALKGVNVANWNIETKQMHVSFNKDKVSLDKIHRTIAAAGYDTEKMKGDDYAYSKLPACCQYTR
ncbi:MAG: efflux RND transporter periplasmic adaptor subunit [Salinivirgaceae bacterium]|nr:efflux RND transporter periplasmic adaptor subunit [Salinivirgaceae bacterium]